MELKHKAIIEAALFMSSEKIHIDDIAKMCNLPKGNVLNLLSELVLDYNDGTRGICIFQSDEFFQMSVAQEVFEDVKHLADEPEISKPEMKTLSIIAYYAPIKQSDVIKFRGNKGYDHIKKLKEMLLVTKEPCGKTVMLRTTQKFIDYFGSDFVKKITEEKPVL